jgi:hypothetical protein
MNWRCSDAVFEADFGPIRKCRKQRSPFSTPMVRKHLGFKNVRSVLLFQATLTDQSLPSSRQPVRSHGKVLLSADTLVSDLGFRDGWIGVDAGR